MLEPKFALETRKRMTGVPWRTFLVYRHSVGRIPSSGYGVALLRLLNWGYTIQAANLRINVLPVSCVAKESLAVAV